MRQLLGQTQRDDEKNKTTTKNRKLLAGKKVKAADELLLLYINADYICRGGMQGEGGAP